MKSGGKRLVSSLLAMIMAIGLFGGAPPAVTAADGDVCAIGGVGYATLSAAINAVPDGIGGEATVIKLLTWVSESSGYVIANKKITFDLNGYRLSIYPSMYEEALQVNGAVIDYVGEGAFEVKSARVALRVTNGGSCRLTDVYLYSGGQYAVYASGAGSSVTVDNYIGASGNATGYGNGIYAESGASVTLNGDIAAYGSAVTAYNAAVTVNGDIWPGYNYKANVYGVYAGAGGKVTVNGDVYVSGAGVYASGADASVTVTGNVSGYEGIGVAVTGGGAVAVGGDVYSSRTTGVSVSSGTVTVDGTIGCYGYYDVCIRIDGNIRSIYDINEPTTRDGYYTYSNASGTSVVWLSGANPLPPPFTAYVNAYIDDMYAGNILAGVTYDRIMISLARLDKSVTGVWNVIITKSGQTQPVLPVKTINANDSYTDISWDDVSFGMESYDIYAYQDGEPLYFLGNIQPGDPTRALLLECSIDSEMYPRVDGVIDDAAGTVTFTFSRYMVLEEIWPYFSLRGCDGSTLYVNGDFDNPMYEYAGCSEILNTVTVVSFDGLTRKEYTVVYNMPGGDEVDLYTMNTYFNTVNSSFYSEGVINHNTRTVTFYVPAEDYGSLTDLDNQCVEFTLTEGAYCETDGYVYSTYEGQGYAYLDLSGGSAALILISPDQTNQKKYTVYVKPRKETDRFSGSVSVSATQTQRGKNVEVIVTYKNDSDENLTATFLVTVSAGVQFVPGSVTSPVTVSANTLTMTQFMEKGREYPVKFWVTAPAGYDKDFFTITAEISDGSEQYFIDDESVALNSITIELPDEVSLSGNDSAPFTIKGEAMALEDSYIVFTAHDPDGETVPLLPDAGHFEPPAIGLWYKLEDIALQGVTAGKTYTITACLMSGDGDVIADAADTVRVVEHAPAITGIAFSFQSTVIRAKNPVTNSSSVSASIYVGSTLRNNYPIKITTDLTDAVDVVSAHYKLYTDGLNRVYSSPEETVSNEEQLSLSAVFDDFKGSGLAKIVLTLKKKDGSAVHFTVANLMLLIDPSGYVYDSVTGGRVEGATATLQYWDGGTDAWIDWEAEEYAQHNRQRTDDQGRYGWFVPEGKYRVLVTADGYYDYNTENDPAYGVIEVLPPRDDINIGLIPKPAGQTPVITSVTVSTPTIVEGLAANLRISVTGENIEGESLIAYLSVNGVLSCRTDITGGDLMRIGAGDAPAYGDDCRIIVRVNDGNVQGGFTMTVAEYKPADLWTADASIVDGNLLIAFRADVELRSATGCVSIGGRKYDAAVLADGRTVEVKGVAGTPAGGTTVVVSGVRYPTLFPSYSFTFTLTLP